MVQNLPSKDIGVHNSLYIDKLLPMEAHVTA
jgi:hypothetical protein